MSKLFTPSRLRSRLIYIGLAVAAVLLLEVGAMAASPLLSPTINTPPRSFAELRAAAEKGDAIAQRLVANAYLTGEGARLDLTEGARWLRAAADQRDPVAQYTLGILYDEGKALPRDLREAVRWYELAAAQGLPDAQFNLAICYSKGEGVPKDLKSAAGWFRKAAEQGDALSQFHLGLAYISGKGVERNHVEATTWLRKAAYQDVATAQFYLGRLYQEGEGVEKEPETALKWYRKAASQGFPDAQYYLGRMLLDASGSDRNPTEGRAFIEKAAAQGHELATQYLASGGRSALGAATAPSPTAPAISPMTAAASGQTATRPAGSAFTSPSVIAPRDGAFQAAPPAQSALTFTAPVAETANNMSPSLPAIPPVQPPGKSASQDFTTKESSLPPFGAPPATKEPTSPAPTRDFLTTPPGGKEPEAGSLFTEPPRAKEPVPEPRGRDAHSTSAANSGGGESTSGLMFIAAISTGISALILFLGVYVAVVFKTRLQGLEAELKKAQFELSKANVNLSAMMHQVEQLSLAAPAVAPKTSLPEWNPEPARAHTTSFKMHRSK